MNYGLYISASGALTALHRQDVLSNNLANMDTAGFKPDLAVAMQRDPARIEDHLAFPSNVLLERLGGGVLQAPSRVSFAPGTPERTDGAFDMAIQGDGFFVVRSFDSSQGDSVRLTRDGRFTLDSQGRLVMATTGYPVLDAKSKPITLPTDAQIRVDASGTIFADRVEVAKIAIVDVPDRTALTKQGHSLFHADAATLDARRPAAGTVMQGFIEGSGVDAFSTMMAVTSAGREVDTNMSLISQQDRMMERAINVFARLT